MERIFIHLASPTAFTLQTARGHDTSALSPASSIFVFMSVGHSALGNFSRHFYDTREILRLALLYFTLAADAPFPTYCTVFRF